MSDYEMRLDWRQWMRDFGGQQRRVREFLGLSQEELARQAGVSEEVVIRLETARGVATPLLIVVKVRLALASEVRRLDPTIIPADVYRAVEMPDLPSFAFRTERRADAERAWRSSSTSIRPSPTRARKGSFRF